MLSESHLPVKAWLKNQVTTASRKHRNRSQPEAPVPGQAAGEPVLVSDVAMLRDDDVTPG